MKRKILVLVLLLVMLAPAATSLAAAPNDRIIGEGDVVDGDVTVLGERLEIREGGVVRGDVTLFDGTADVEGTIEGDVSIFDGEMVLAGVVEGDVVVFDGRLILEEGAVIEADCLSFGGEVEDESEGASCSSIGNGLAESLGRFRPPFPEVPLLPSPPSPPPGGVTPSSLAARVGEFFLGVFQLAGLSLSLGVLALVVTAIFPRQLEQVGAAIRRKPAASGVVGLLTAIAGPSLIVLLLVVLAVTCVGILLYPAVFLLGLVLLAAAVMGWVALGDLLGRTVLEPLGLRGPSLPLTAALGTALLTLAVGALGLLPFVWGEWLVIVLLLCVGLGGAALTQFGTKPYPPGSAGPKQREGAPDVTVDV